VQKAAEYLVRVRSMAASRSAGGTLAGPPRIPGGRVA